MNQLTALLDLLSSFGFTDDTNTIYEDGRTFDDDRTYTITVEDDIKTVTLAKGIGYLGFECEFRFDSTGKFIMHGVWE